MAKDTSFARATPVLTDDVRGVDDPGGTPLTRRFLLSAIYTLFKTSFDAVYQTIMTKAAGADVDTGTDDAKYLTAKAINDSHNTPLVAPSTSGNLMTSNGTDWTSAAPAKIAGDTVQTVYTTNVTKTTGTTVVPLDDTIPQNTEGDEIMTLAITPTSATNRLVIEAIVFANPTAINFIVGCLFQDTTAGALRVAPVTAGAAYYSEIVLRHEMAAGTTSATTFKIRCGGTNADTITYNGRGSNREFGGVLASSIRITEIKV